MTRLIPVIVDRFVFLEINYAKAFEAMVHFQSIRSGT